MGLRNWIGLSKPTTERKRSDQCLLCVLYVKTFRLIKKDYKVTVEDRKTFCDVQEEKNPLLGIFHNN